ncbi:hypothetical protein [Acetobacter pasteurianus]|uniref:Uncharacterized protein n=1 Tax=Acetobacter pasteurianus subsp. pasteurianus TaxID=481145 RepID=A0AAC9X274_ACEPA|nr:hypothetical protein [Acetobacter pasteurianus]ASC05184.1 hypothetical protein S101468_00917 [Acetobacter pasteurianus subsp. pasteurianus]
MPSTLLLDRSSWDLVADASGNIAVADAPYAVAQDTASAVRVFQGECWYDTDLGLPYLNNILGRTQSAPVFRSDVEAEAKTVPLVESAQCALTAMTISRQLTGQILLKLTDGTQLGIGFGSTTYFTLDQSALNSSDVLL